MAIQPVRPRGARRRATLTNPAQQPPIELVFVSYVDAVALFEMLQPQSGLTTNGVPLFRNVTQDTVATAINVLSPTQLEVTFSDPLADGDVLTIDPFDTGLRNRWGGFIQSGEWTIPVAPAPPEPQVIEWSPSLQDPGNDFVLLSVDNPGLRVGLTEPSSVANQPSSNGGQAFLAALWQGANTIQLQFDSAFSGGEEISVPVGCDIAINETGGFVQNGTFQINF